MHSASNQVKKAMESTIYENDKILEKCYTKCSSEKDILNNVKKAKQFLSDIIFNDGELKVNFHQAIGRTNGRKFGQGIQGISCEIRNFLLQNQGVVDVDIEKCAQSIILFLMISSGAKCIASKSSNCFFLIASS